MVRKSHYIGRYIGLAYASAAVIGTWVFFATFVVFVGNLPKLKSPWLSPSLDVGSGVEPSRAVLIDLGLIALFGLQHSIMARPAFKRWWSAYVPAALERATYVHAANLAGFLLIFCWQPMPDALWRAEHDGVKTLLWIGFALGWLLLFGAAFSMDLLELLGFRQAWHWFRGVPLLPLKLKTNGIYGALRHPMYVGLLLAVWSTPYLSIGHAILAVGFTIYILIASRFEERDLAQRFGGAYSGWRPTPGSIGTSAPPPSFTTSANPTRPRRNDASAFRQLRLELDAIARAPLPPQMLRLLAQINTTSPSAAVT